MSDTRSIWSIAGLPRCTYGFGYHLSISMGHCQHAIAVHSFEFIHLDNLHVQEGLDKSVNFREPIITFAFVD